MSTSTRSGAWWTPVAVALIGAAVAGCDSRPRGMSPLTFERMRDQPKYEAYGPSYYFADGKAMRPLPAGTVPREAGADDAQDTGRANGALVTTIPLQPTHDLMVLGQQRYDTFCRPCHDTDGSADTPVAGNMQLRRPPSLLEPRIRALPVGRIFEVISGGYGLMPSYAYQLAPRERWAVVAYVRALQLRDGVTPAELNPSMRAEARKALGAGGGHD